MFRLDPDARMTFRKYFSLEGNIMDLAALENRQKIIYSIDHYHVSTSTTEIANREVQLSRPLMSSISLDQNGDWKQTKIFEEAIGGLLLKPETREPPAGSLQVGGKPLSDFLYSVESLRKQAQEEQDQ